jgi:uncharacterized membrane protein YecN with MAPEG domain
MQIVPLYAALLSFIFVFLSIKTISTRRSLKIGIGHANNEKMLRIMRVHSNFAEYVPLALILLFFLETQGAHNIILHGLCSFLVVGRCLHAFGVSQENEKFVFRVTGMALTFTTILSCGSYIILSAIFKF